MRAALAALSTLTLSLAGCAAPPVAEDTCGHVKTDRAVLVLERGDQTSAIARLSDGCLTESPPDIVLGYDQNLLGAGDRAFLGLNEDGVLRELDPRRLSLGAALEVYRDVHDSTGIHGIYGVAVDAAENLWVSLDDAGSLAIVAPDGSSAGTVDLSGVDDDGIPETNGILVRDGRAYVAVGFLPTDELSDQAKRSGAIVVIDTGTRQRTGMIEMIGKNPVRAFVPAGEPSEVLIATPGDHDAVDDLDGIERVWLDGSKPPAQLVSERELDGSVDDVVWGGPGEVYAIVLGREPGLNPTRVVAIDPSRPAGERVTRELARAPWFDDPVNGAAYVHVGLALTGEHLLVADKTPGQGRIRVFSRATGEELPAIPTRVHPPAALLALP